MNDDLREIIINALSSLNIPISYMKYDGTDDTYITFFEYMGQGASFSEDIEDCKEHYIQINVFYRTEINDLQKQIMDLLTQQDFTESYTKDLGFDDDTQRYWSVICVNYLENLID